MLCHSMGTQGMSVSCRMVVKQKVANSTQDSEDSMTSNNKLPQNILIDLRIGLGYGRLDFTFFLSKLTFYPTCF